MRVADVVLPDPNQHLGILASERLDQESCRGSLTRPMNSGVAVSTSWITNKKGRSAVNATGRGPNEVRVKTTPVAAAASVPSSSTATKASCTTALTLRG